MELFILFLILAFSRSGVYRYNRASVYTYQTRLREIDEMDRRIQQRLRNAKDYLNECERTGNEEYLEFAREERDKVWRMIEEFKKENNV